MSVHDKCSDIYFKCFSFMVLKKWHALEISNLTKDLYAPCVALSERALRGDANKLQVQGAVPFLLPKAEKGAGEAVKWNSEIVRGERCPSCRLPRNLLRFWPRLRHGPLPRRSAWDNHLFDLGVSCLDPVPISNKKKALLPVCSSSGPPTTQDIWQCLETFQLSHLRGKWVAIGIK